MLYVLQGRDHATRCPFPSKPCIARGDGAPNDVVKSGRGAFQSSAWSLRGGDGSDAGEGLEGRQATGSSSQEENMSRPKATKSPRSQSRQSSDKS